MVGLGFSAVLAFFSRVSVVKQIHVYGKDIIWIQRYGFTPVTQGKVPAMVLICTIRSQNSALRQPTNVVTGTFFLAVPAAFSAAICE